jgi:hypothetical protein
VAAALPGIPSWSRAVKPVSQEGTAVPLLAITATMLLISSARFREEHAPSPELNDLRTANHTVD